MNPTSALRVSASTSQFDSTSARADSGRPVMDAFTQTPIEISPRAPALPRLPYGGAVASPRPSSLDLLNDAQKKTQIILENRHCEVSHANSNRILFKVMALTGVGALIGCAIGFGVAGMTAASLDLILQLAATTLFFAVMWTIAFSNREIAKKHVADVQNLQADHTALEAHLRNNEV